MAAIALTTLPNALTGLRCDGCDASGVEWRLRIGNETTRLCSYCISDLTMALDEHGSPTCERRSAP
jgi:hypothetical protein